MIVSVALAWAAALLAPTSVAAQGTTSGPGGHGAAVHHEVTSVVLPDVTLRDGVTADLRVTVYLNGRRPCGGTVFAQHGAWHSAAVWEPFANALFDRVPRAHPPCRVIALNLPGHGQSSQPEGALFGELTLDDYVTAVIGALDRLKALGIRPRTIVGHSMGGAIVQLVQQRLSGADTNLRRAYGVRDAVLFGSANLEPIPSLGVDYAALFAAFTVSDPERGWVVAFPVPVWRLSMFGNLTGGFGPGTPTPEDIVARGYMEPMSAGLVDAFVDRPYVDAELFDRRSGTALTVVSFEQDRLVPGALNRLLYEHLTGDATDRRFVVVPGTDSVHDLFISDPVALLSGMGQLAHAF
jgi:pimeloyl-ACP methyl ester carboxylesterase